MVEFTDIPDCGGAYGWNIVISMYAWAWTGETPLGGGWITIP